MAGSRRTNNRRFVATCVCLVSVIAIFLGCGSSNRNRGVSTGNSGETEEANGMRYTFGTVSFDSNEYASANEVDRAVKSHVTGEGVEYVGTFSGCMGEGYEYASIDRDLTFVVRSDLEGVSINPLSVGADAKKQVVYVYYPVGVCNYYDDEISAVLEESSLVYEDAGDDYNYNTGGFFARKLTVEYTSYEELDYVAEVLAKIDDIYKQETAYNSQAFLTEYPVRKVVLEYTGQGQEKGYPVSGLLLDGTQDKASLYGRITKDHAESIANGKIVDDTTPDDLKQASHKDSLFNICLDGVNITDMAYDERYMGKQERTHAYREDVIYTSVYYEPLDTYLILFDTGTTAQPDLHMSTTEYYINELAGSSEVSLGQEHSHAAWTFNGDEWYIGSEEGEYGAKELFSTVITCNGAVQNIPVVYPWDGIRMNPNYFGIPVENFAEMFDLSYEIDETADDGTIYFTRR